MKHESNDQVAAQLGFATVAGERFLPGHDRLRWRAAAGSPATNNSLDAVASHEVQPSLAGTDDWLPAVDGTAQWTRHQGDLLELVAAVGHPRWQRVVLATVSKGRLVEGFEDDFELLFEQLAIGVRIEHRCAECLDLARVVAAADAEEHAPTRQIIGSGVVFGQPQRVPHRQDVEAAAKLDPLREMREMHSQEKDVGNAFVPF